MSKGGVASIFVGGTEETQGKWYMFFRPQVFSNTICYINSGPENFFADTDENQLLKKSSQLVN